MPYVFEQSREIIPWTPLDTLHGTTHTARDAPQRYGLRVGAVILASCMLQHDT